MSLAGTREPRKTAGNRMSKLLDAEEEDEFYKTTYGGFNDVSRQKRTDQHRAAVLALTLC